MLPTIWSGCHRFALPLRPTKDVDVLTQVEVGDVVSFLVYHRNGDTRSLGKRISGLPGDRVETIDGKVVRVPDGCFWALGDNPEESTDSRHFGAVPASNLRCKILVVYTEDTVTDPPRLRFRVL